jgi:precorrin-3B synthase
MTRRGWCPTLYEPMAAQDGLLVRVKPPSGLLKAEAAMVLAAAATRLGNGVVQLTNRGNLQFRGLSAESVLAFADIVAGLGLAETDPGAERRRNVLVSPLHGVDPAVHPATDGLARALAAMLTQARDFEVLPGKFGIVVDGGGLWSMVDAPGDLFVALRGNAVLVSIDRVIAAVLAPGDAVQAVRELIAAFLRMGDARRVDGAQAALLFAAAGLDGPTIALPVAAGPGVRETVGELLPGCFGVGAAFGQMQAADLHALAGFSRNHGDGTLRVTPWRGFVLGGVSALPELADYPGLITKQGDARLAIVACVGSPGCAQSSVQTLEDAEILARSVPPGQVLHVSGCSKGCAHPGVAAVVLVGEAGRYNLVREGRADAVPVLHGLDVAAVAEILEAARA